jgi:hypothetical protein
MFRSPELVGVTWQDVCFSAEGARALIYVPLSKTDQVGQGAWVFIAACREELLMCPVAALRLLKGEADREHADPTGPVIRGRAGYPGALAN